MFENLTNRLSKTVHNLSGHGRITENNVSDTMRELQRALLEADIALPVVKQFIDKIRERAIGQEVMKSLTPGQALVKIVSDELTSMMGEANEELNLQTQPPAVILMAGLQGAGKTTTVAKLAKLLIEQKKSKVMLTSADIYRPAAISQLEILAKEVGAEFHPSDSSLKPETIATDAIAQAKKQFCDVVIVDTAGRLHIDKEMMVEIQQIHAAINPIETLFVVDSMTGQDAANTAKAFNEALPLTGIILTKIDGDARGGAALSTRAITGKPIKFIGVGEKMAALEPFYPDRIASQILGQGDVVSLVEEIEAKVDKKKADKLAKKIKKGKGFNLEDFRSQIQQMNNMGGMMGLVSKIPGMSNMPQAVKNQMDDKLMSRIEAIINSMTPRERNRPDIIKGSRKRRIAAGSGTTIQNVNSLLKQFSQMQKMMKKFSKKGNMMKMMSQLQGKLPAGINDMF